VLPGCLAVVAAGCNSIACNQPFSFIVLVVLSFMEQAAVGKLLLVGWLRDAMLVVQPSRESPRKELESEWPPMVLE